jgi:endonuclease G
MLDAGLAGRLRDALLRLPGIEERGTRKALLTGIPVPLTRNDNHWVDLTSIIDQLDGLGRLDNGERPVVILANNARSMVSGTELAKLLAGLAREVEDAYGSEPLAADVPEIPEALVFGGTGEWVTSAFLEQARLVGTRVARLRVPRIVSGVEEHAVGAVGTGWLIGPRLLLTNHHVVNAREPGEPAATAGDFDKQGARTVAWFDYYVEGRESLEIAVVEVVGSSLALDYALLRLEDSPHLQNRAAIALPQKRRALTRGTRLNIVQCPNGGPLRYAIRNNFFVGRGEREFQMRYLTDTLKGSSGSPVMDDDWQVVALHHGARKVAPGSYKGEPGVEGIVKYHNQGIDILAIVADLPAAARGEIATAHGWT